MLLIEPNEKQKISIRKELNENENTSDQELEQLKDWLKKQPHLPDSWDDVPLMNFLRYSKFSLEKAKKKLDVYFSTRAAFPDIFTDRDVGRPGMRGIIEISQFAILPNLTPDCYRVIVSRLTNHDFVTPKVADAFRLLFMVADIYYNIENGAAGLILIIDASGVNLKHFFDVISESPVTFKKLIVSIQAAYPLKVKEIHVINPSPIVDLIYKWILPLLKEKFKKRICIHGDREDLFKYVSKEMVPKEFGGNGGSVVEYADQMVKNLEDFGPWFKEQESVKADESKRIENLVDGEEGFGLEGSFRKIEID